MKQPNVNTLSSDVRKLSARVTALEKLLERILRQKPVSEKQLERALNERGSNGRKTTEC